MHLIEQCKAYNGQASTCHTFPPLLWALHSENLIKARGRCFERVSHGAGSRICSTVPKTCPITSNHRHHQTERCGGIWPVVALVSPWQSRVNRHPGQTSTVRCGWNLSHDMIAMKHQTILKKGSTKTFLFWKKSQIWVGGWHIDFNDGHFFVNLFFFRIDGFPN